MLECWPPVLQCCWHTLNVNRWLYGRNNANLCHSTWRMTQVLREGVARYFPHANGKMSKAAACEPLNAQVTVHSGTAAYLPTDY